MFDFLKSKKESQEPADPELAQRLCVDAENHLENEEPKKAERLFARAMEIYKRLYSENKAQYADDLASCCSSLGGTLEELEKYTEAYEYYSIAAEIYQELSASGDAGYREALADEYSDIGDTYLFRDKYNEAEEYYLKSLEIYESLSAADQKNDPDSDKYQEDIAYCYDSLAKSYSAKENYSAAVESYEQVTGIYEQLLEKTDDQTDEEVVDGYRDDLAEAYTDMGYIYSCTGALEEAEEFYLKAAELYLLLAKKDREQYIDELVSQYEDLAILYADMEKPDKEQEYNRKSKNPEV